MNNQLTKIMGGSPLSVLVKLIGLSIAVGLILHSIGFNPYRLLHPIEELFFFIVDNAWNLMNGLTRYFAMGAVIVFPIWLIMRVLARKEHQKTLK